MDAKQNMVFFIGLILIIMVFWVNGYWTILKNGIITPSSAGASTKTPGTTPIPKVGNSCPAGYYAVGNMCVPESM
jgi:hypothetical protein